MKLMRLSALLTSHIKQPIQCYDGRTCDCHLERLGELPAVGMRVVTLDRVQAEGPLPTANCIHKAIQHRQAYSERKQYQLNQIFYYKKVYVMYGLALHT